MYIQMSLLLCICQFALPYDVINFITDFAKTVFGKDSNLSVADQASRQ